MRQRGPKRNVTSTGNVRLQGKSEQVMVQLRELRHHQVRMHIAKFTSIMVPSLVPYLWKASFLISCTVQVPFAECNVLPVVTPSHTIPTTDHHYIGKSIDQHKIADRQDLSETAKWLLCTRESDAASSTAVP